MMSTGSQWLWLSLEWKRYIAAVNRKLKSQGRPPIFRYHATDCANYINDFEGWSKHEQIDLVKGLFGILRRHPTNSIAYVTDLNDVCEVFPKHEKDRLHAGYTVLTTYVMYQILMDCKAQDGHVKQVVLFHDRNPYDNAMQDAFKLMVQDPEYNAFFPSLTPMSSEHCIPLQPADLVAYEMFKEAHRKLSGRNRRKSLEGLLSLESFGIRSKTLTKDALLSIRKRMP